MLLSGVPCIGPGLREDLGRAKVGINNLAFGPVAGCARVACDVTALGACHK